MFLLLAENLVYSLILISLIWTFFCMRYVFKYIYIYIETEQGNKLTIIVIKINLWTVKIGHGSLIGNSWTPRVQHCVFKVSINQWQLKNISRITQWNLRDPQGWSPIRWIGCHTITMWLPGDIIPVIQTTQEQYATNRNLSWKLKTNIVSGLQSTSDDEKIIQASPNRLSETPRVEIQVGVLIITLW